MNATVKIVNVRTSDWAPITDWGLFGWKHESERTAFFRPIDEKLLTLRNTIGPQLFDRLSSEDKLLMIRTAGSIDFGRSIDLDTISKVIKADGHTH